MTRPILHVLLVAAFAAAPAAARVDTPEPARQTSPAPVPKADTPVGDNPRVNVSAASLQDFKTRIDQYIALRKTAAGDAPALKQTRNPAEIKAAEDGLAAAIRAKRPDARPGDILTPDVQTVFRKVLAPQLKGHHGEHAKEVLKDDAPDSVPLKVNAKYPEGKALPTVPSNLLINLPKLPPELEYRIVGRSLILRDTGADLIVDFMLNAVG
jgi:hypothetical protein